MDVRELDEAGRAGAESHLPSSITWAVTWDTTGLKYVVHALNNHTPILCVVENFPINKMFDKTASPA